MNNGRQAPRRISHANFFKLANYLQSCHEQHTRDRPSYIEVAKKASEVLGHEVTDKHVYSTARQTGFSWSPKPQRGTGESSPTMNYYTRLRQRLDGLESRIVAIETDLGVKPKPADVFGQPKR